MFIFCREKMGMQEQQLLALAGDKTLVVLEVDSG